MVLTLFATVFIGGFIALAAFGHILLIDAIWPDLFGKNEHTTDGEPPPALRHHGKAAN
jgi:hypothetical protein